MAFGEQDEDFPGIDPHNEKISGKTKDEEED